MALKMMPPRCWNIRERGQVATVKQTTQRARRYHSQKPSPKVCRNFGSEYLYTREFFASA